MCGWGGVDYCGCEWRCVTILRPGMITAAQIEKIIRQPVALKKQNFPARVGFA